MTGGKSGLREPSYGAVRALAIVFGVVAVAVTALLVLAIMTLLSRQPIFGHSSPSPAPSASGNPAPGTSGIANPGAVPSSAPLQARAGHLPRTAYPPGEPPGDIEDEYPPGHAASKPPPNASSPSLLQLLPTPSLAVPVPTPRLP